jgi:hypothetical protein
LKWLGEGGAWVFSTEAWAAICMTVGTTHDRGSPHTPPPSPCTFACVAPARFATRSRASAWHLLHCNTRVTACPLCQAYYPVLLANTRLWIKMKLAEPSWFGSASQAASGGTEGAGKAGKAGEAAASTASTVGA